MTKSYEDILQDLHLVAMNTLIHNGYNVLEARLEYGIEGLFVSKNGVSHFIYLIPDKQVYVTLNQFNWLETCEGSIALVMDKEDLMLFMKGSYKRPRHLQGKVKFIVS